MNKLNELDCGMCQAFISEHVAPACPKHLREMYEDHDCRSYGRDSGQACDGCKIYFKFAWITQKPIEAIL